MTSDFEVTETGTLNLVKMQQERIEELEAGLRDIVTMKSCLLADAQEIAQKLMEKRCVE